MSEFSGAMASAWDPAVTIFGDTITVDDVDYDCVIHGLGVTDGIGNNRPGRSQFAEGSVVMKRTDWVTSGQSKGARVVIGEVTYRVTNDPLKTATSDTVTLNIGPLT